MSENIIQAVSAPGAAQSTPSPPQPPQPPPPPLTLLFVDDEPSILSALRRLFRPAGYRIFTAEGGQAGLDVLERETVDLVISDMRMPGMDGAQFLEQVRARSPKVVRLLLTGYADVASTIAAINKGEIYRYISKPWDDNEIQLIVRDALERSRLEQENKRLLAELTELNAGLERKVEERTAEVRQTMSFLELANQNLKKTFLNMVRVFSSLIELRGGATMGGHSRRVADQARELAKKMGVDPAGVNNVFVAGLLHDVGKIGLPDNLLTKPFNSLTQEERALLLKHPAQGENVLMAIDQLKEVGRLVRHHHERFDGGGYPDGLSGLNIPIEARILSVVNEFDSLQIGTLANRPLNPEEATRFLLDNRGKRYDPAVVDAFTGYLVEKKKIQVEELMVRATQLKPGMVLARDLIHADGYILLAKGYQIDQPVIDQLARLEQSDKRVLQVPIVPPAGGAAR